MDAILYDNDIINALISISDKKMLMTVILIERKVIPVAYYGERPQDAR